MKTTAAILLLSLTACSRPDNVQAPDRTQDTFSINRYFPEIIDTQRTSGDREFIDSAHFSIIRGKYISGAKFIDVYQNKLTKLDSWKEYYENGQLKKEGLMTTSNHNYVGIWKYYSDSGRLDSLVDHDKKYRISYYRALEIAKKNGFEMPDMEVSLHHENDTVYWQIARWRENEEHTGRSAEFMLIETGSGKVSRPDYMLMSIY
jgi:hypothetical protein